MNRGLGVIETPPRRHRRDHAPPQVLPEEREALLPPDEHDYVMRQEKVRPPSITQLKAVAKTPFLMPYPSMTLNRTLLGVNLPECSKLELPAKQCDDSRPPVLDPQARRDLAAVGLARRRAKLGRNTMRDPRDDTRRYRKLLGGFPGNYKPKQQEVEAAFKFKPPQPKAGVVMAGPGYKAAKAMVRDDDRRPIHANLGGALNSLVGVRGAQISDMSETFAKTRRAEAAALREARLDGTYREPWDIEPELLRSTQEVLADGLKSFEKTSTEKWPTVRELSPRRAAAKVGELARPSYEYAAAPPPDRSSTPGPMFRFHAEAPTVSRKSVRGSLRTTPTPSLSS